MEIWPGSAHPLGATYDGGGVNFALFSEVAEQVELCLLDDYGEQRVGLVEVDHFVHHAYVPGLHPGQRYGYRVHGPYDPAGGHRCNPAKLLLDPYAKAVDGALDWDASLFGYSASGPDSRNDDDSFGHTMASVVVNPFFDWSGDRSPGHSYADTVFYEAHAKGLTMLHPDVPERIRGTYAGLAHPAVVEHLTRLGVTAIELLPVHQFVQRPSLLDRRLSNYWGYDTVAFFAPHNEYSSAGTRGQQVSEFKAMVRSLHVAQIEVILDVVLNHTAEGNHLGPTLSFRGIDNAAYYRLVDDDRRFYYDTTGTGNVLQLRHPHVLQLVMDCLRYWVTEMHVDGFRFDLASSLARQLNEAERLPAFFDVLRQDPVLSQVKLVAEPWDVGAGGYQVDHFPALWTEWTGRYRDTVRDYWRGGKVTADELGNRLAGSPGEYSDEPGQPFAAVNFVTAHDGFTLRDLVSYDEKHNEANGEDNNDGESHNLSWNCGVEGETKDPQVNALRARQQRNLLGTLLLSQGVPMILHGDELGRSQRGNNNAYCQDNEISWVDWALAEQNDALLTFVRRAIALRRSRRVLRRRFLDVTTTTDDPFGVPDAAMLSAEGPLSGAGAFGMYLNGHPAEGGIWSGGDIGEEDLLVLLNAGAQPATFRLPAATYSPTWRPTLSTDSPDGVPDAEEYAAAQPVTVAERSLLVLLGPSRGGPVEDALGL